MDTELLKYLNESEQAQLRTLLADCAAADGCRYDYPDEADFYYLIRNTEKEESGSEAELAAMLCAYQLGETWEGRKCLELCAYTHPDFRRLGLFRQCFYSLKDDFRGFAFKFMLHSPSGEAAVRALGGRYLHDELMMERVLPAPIADPGDGLCCREGEVYFYPLGERVLYLYGLLVYDRYRGRGHGHRLLRALDTQPPGPFERVRLQVSSANHPAFHLYQSEGFQIIEKISAYVIA